MPDPEKIQKIYPLSNMQLGMLYHTLLEPHSPAYFEQMIFSLAGNLDRDIFEKSFNTLIQRHDILRTSFVYENIKKPRQVVLKKRVSTVDFQDLSSFEKKSQQSFIAEYKSRDREKGFILTGDQLIRTTLFKVGVENYQVIWSFHHILMDGWCIGILIKEFFQIYHSLKNKICLNLEPVYAYSDYIAWLEKQDKDEAGAYWRNYLSGYGQKASVPHLNRYKKDGYIQKNISYTLDEELTSKLKETAALRSVTVNTMIQSIWGVLLQKYNNTNDVVFGSVVSGRPAEVAGIESMIGLFINTIPVRIRCDERDTFDALVKQVQEAAIESEKYSHVPLAEIQSITELKQELMDHIIIFENYPIEQEIENLDSLAVQLRIGHVEVFEQTNYDFNMILGLGNELVIKFSFNERVYVEDFVERIAKHFKAILKMIVANIDVNIEEINFFSLEEKQQILHEFNATEAGYPKDKTFQQLFEEQVNKTPDHIMLVYEAQQLTYGEVNAKANGLARTLKDKGVGTDSVVGLMAERSPEMIIGILGILKSGGAYLPIDPEYPAERIGFMLKDSNAGILLTQSRFQAEYDLKQEVLPLDDAKIYDGESSDPEVASQPHHLAYIIYTSGSTGKPKGVMIEHRSIINTLHWRRTEYQMNGNDTALQLFNVVFDGFLTSFFTPCLSGAKTVLLNRIDAQNPDAIKDCITSQKVTHFISVPSLYQLILEAATPEELVSLRVVTLAGDKVTEEIVKRSQAKNPTLEIVNEYGPTENSVVATFKRNVNPETGISIGKPIANTKVYIVNHRHEPKPIGVPGELCIAGDSLARGYLNMPELTAEKFIPNPFMNTMEGLKTFPLSPFPFKLYQTGDLARWLFDGDIEFLGRIDHQVKIRGFRIEPGEIENLLRKHETVKEAVVVAKTDTGGNQYLCACLIAAKELTLKELRDYLFRELPDYMIPSRFVQLEKLPLTPNEKIDRRALSKLEDGYLLNTGVEYVAPETDLERAIVNIWQEVLKRDCVGIDDNFFDIGGNSILLIQLNSLVKQRLIVESPPEISLMTFFEHPTVRSLVKYINQEQEMKNEEETALDNLIDKNKKILQRTLNHQKGVRNE